MGIGFQLSDDIMDLVSSERELGKEPGVDMKEGVYTLPVIHALERSAELRTLLEQGPPDGDALVRALEITAFDGSLQRSRDAVTREVRRARELAGSLPEGGAQEALVKLAEFIAERCGAGT